MESSIQSPDCRDHPSKKIIAVCLTPGCHTNLCESCFANHSIQHAQAGTHMQLNSLEDLRKQAQQKLESTMKEAKTRKAAFDLFANSSGSEALKKEINEIRSLVVQTTMDYFDDLEHKVSVMTSDTSQTREKQIELFEREINRFIQNLHNMSDNLKVKNSIMKTMMHAREKDFSGELDLIDEKCNLPFETTVLTKTPSFENALMQFFAANVKLTKVDPPLQKKDSNRVDIEDEELGLDKLHQNRVDNDAAQQEKEGEENSPKKVQCNQQ